MGSNVSSLRQQHDNNNQTQSSSLSSSNAKISTVEQYNNNNSNVKININEIKKEEDTSKIHDQNSSSSSWWARMKELTMFHDNTSSSSGGDKSNHRDDSNTKKNHTAGRDDTYYDNGSGDDDDDLPIKTNRKSLETPILLQEDYDDDYDDDNNDNDGMKSNLPNNHGNNPHSFPIPTGKEYDLIDKIASELPSVIDEESSQQVKDYIEACDNGKGPMVACFSTAEYLSLFLRKHKEAALLYENTCFRPASDKSPNGVLLSMDRNKTKAYPPACFNLAQMRMTGKGGTKFSRFEGYQLFDRACRAGHGGSCMMQAKMLASYPGSLGEKIPYDPKRASELLASVCDNGDSLSCFTLATMLLRGDFVNAEADNVSPDEARGLKPIKQRKNEANRKKELQDERIALPRDPQRAEKLLLKGCDQSGHAPSCYNLAVMYTQGDDGIAKDEEKAKKYQQKTEDLVSKFGGFGFGGGM